MTMDEVTFENTRFDPDQVEFHDIAKQMAKSVGYTAELSIDGKLAQLLHEALKTHFDEKAIAEIAAIAINMNLWTRLKLAQGAVPVMQG